MLTADTLFVGAGDIAECAPERGDLLTAALIEALPTAQVFTLGDNAYPDGSKVDYQNCYDPSWGRFKARTRPALGNHEYDTGNADGAFDYFGDAAWGNSRPNGYYSYDFGAWPIVVLNDNRNFVPIDSSSAQVAWLRNDLAGTAQPCILAIWHRPLFYSTANATSGPRTQSGRKNFWDALYHARADIVLNGHQHTYERFAKQDSRGKPQSDGIREFIVGTGGESTGPVATEISPNSEVQHGGVNQFGVLKLTLLTTSYRWEFIPAGNNSFTDAGAERCNRPQL